MSQPELSIGHDSGTVMGFELTQQMHPSRETPVYDAMGLEPIHLKVLNGMLTNIHGINDVIICGTTSAGKETTIGQMLYRQQHDIYDQYGTVMNQDIRDKIAEIEKMAGRPITNEWIATAHGIWRGRQLGVVTSPIGEFNRDDVLGTDLAMNERLDYSSRHSLRPLQRFIEIVVHGDPFWKLGTNVLRHSVAHARRDPQYRAHYLFIVGTHEVQQGGLRTREDIAQATSVEEAKTAAEKHGMILIEGQTTPVAEFNQRWGNRNAAKLVEDGGNKDAWERRKYLRNKYDLSIPPDLTREQLEHDPTFHVLVQTARAHQIFDRFGVPETDRMVVVNHKLDDVLIPYYRELVKQIEMVRVGVIN